MCQYDVSYQCHLHVVYPYLFAFTQKTKPNFIKQNSTEQRNTAQHGTAQHVLIVVDHDEV